MGNQKDLNKRLTAWIASLHSSVDRFDVNLKQDIMKPAGAKCAQEVLSLCEEYLGKEVDALNDLVTGWNLLREKRNLTGGWNFEGDNIRGIFGECSCPLVRFGQIELHPVQCYYPKV